ncbi:MAG: DUF362 domain-containing protein [Mastigocoleus sp.]
MQTQPPSVSLVKANSYERQILRESLNSLLEPLGGMKTFVKPGQTVLLKPNLLTASRPGKECTTRREVVHEVAKMVIEVGGKPFIGDSPAFGSARGVAIANGYQTILDELELPIVDFHGQRYQVVNEKFNHLLLSKEAMNADVVINLPKVKSHVQLVLTLGVKNLFGCVPGKMKAWWHMEAGKDSKRFGDMLVETAQAINPDLTILDGIIGHQGNGPSGGEPRDLGVLAASANVYALDRAMIEILNVPPMQVPTVAASIRGNLCPPLDTIFFPGLHPNILKIEDWQLPDNFVPIDFGMPRVVKSTFKHLYIRFIKEPIKAYGQR